MSAEQVAVVPQCEECRELWLPRDVERWQAYWIDNGPADMSAMAVDPSGT
jgi:hypothetical protein